MFAHFRVEELQQNFVVMQAGASGNVFRTLYSGCIFVMSTHAYRDNECSNLCLNPSFRIYTSILKGTHAQNCTPESVAGSDLQWDVVYDLKVRRRTFIHIRISVLDREPHPNNLILNCNNQGNRDDRLVRDRRGKIQAVHRRVWNYFKVSLLVPTFTPA